MGTVLGFRGLGLKEGFGVGVGGGGKFSFGVSGAPGIRGSSGLAGSYRFRVLDWDERRRVL